MNNLEHLPPRVRFIVVLVAKYFGITPRVLLGYSRRRDDVIPRQVAICLVSAVTDASSSQVGRWFSRDHSTVLNAISRVKSRARSDKLFSDQLEHLASQSDGKINEASVEELIGKIGDKVKLAVLEKLRELASRDPQDLARALVPELWRSDPK